MRSPAGAGAACGSPEGRVLLRGMILKIEAGGNDDQSDSCKDGVGQRCDRLRGKGRGPRRCRQVRAGRCVCGGERAAADAGQRGDGSSPGGPAGRGRCGPWRRLDEGGNAPHRPDAGHGGSLGAAGAGRHRRPGRELPGECGADRTPAVCGRESTGLRRAGRHGERQDESAVFC